MLVNDFRDAITDMTIDNGTPVLYTNANAHIGVGDSATAATATQTDLQGVNIRKAMESTFPNKSQGANIMRFKSSYGTTEANFAWNEWAVFNAASSGIMMNRKVESLGTKNSSQTWELTVDIQINLA